MSINSNTCSLLQMLRKPHKPSSVSLAQVLCTGDDTRHSLWVNYTLLFTLSGLLTHCVSHPACLHIRTPFDEQSRTKPHRHLFSTPSSFCGTLLCLDRLNSSGISERISAAIANEGFCMSLAFRLTPLAPFPVPLLSCTMYISCYVTFNLCPLMATSVEGSCIIRSDPIPKSLKFGTNVSWSSALATSLSMLTSPASLPPSKLLLSKSRLHHQSFQALQARPDLERDTREVFSGVFHCHL